MSDSVVVVAPVELPKPRPKKRWFRFKLLGPHFFFDIIRLARGRRVRDLRMLYTFGMLLALLILYMARFRWLSFGDLFFGAGQTMPTNSMAEFAERFVFSILFMQNLAVFLMTPIYLGSCITEEKERRSLELLFISPLSNREILFGKLGARMVHLGGVLLAGLPILSLAQLWGGVDMASLLLNFANTFFNLLTVGCFSLLISVLMRRTLYAVITVYGVMLPFLLIFGVVGVNTGVSPFGFLQFHTATVAVFSGLIFMHLLVSTLSLVLAHVFLRKTSELPPRWLEPPRQPRRVRQAVPERTIRVVRDFAVPPVTEEPLFWKEYYFGPRPHGYLLFWLLSTVFLFAPLGLLGLIFLLQAGMHHPGRFSELHNFGVTCRVLAIGCGMLFIFWSAFRAAASLVRERQNKTLDELLTIPMERTAVLGYKWLGSILHGWIFALFFGAVVLLGILTTGLHLAGGILLLGAVLIHAFFWTTLGLYLSVVCRTVLAAYTRLGLTLLFIIICTALYAGVVDFGRGDWGGYFLACGLNPFASWWICGFTSYEYATFDVQKASVGGCLAGILVYALLTLCLWLLAYGRFQRERYRHVE